MWHWCFYLLSVRLKMHCTQLISWEWAIRIIERMYMIIKQMYNHCLFYFHFKLWTKCCLETIIRFKKWKGEMFLLPDVARCSVAGLEIIQLFFHLFIHWMSCIWEPIFYVLENINNMKIWYLILSSSQAVVETEIHKLYNKNLHPVPLCSKNLQYFLYVLFDFPSSLDLFMLFSSLRMWSSSQLLYENSIQFLRPISNALFSIWLSWFPHLNAVELNTHSSLFLFITLFYSYGSLSCSFSTTWSSSWGQTFFTI